ncbi:MAG: hypothetical protein HY343_11925 [Lentisphaerae bacterium]|nr:hypothetical protein [Lentisphaerota bacterium]
MPIREYQADNPEKACAYCRESFEQLESLQSPPIESCPRCGGRVIRLISAPRVLGSKSGLDDRAKSAGFHKFKKLGRGEYERKY